MTLEKNKLYYIAGPMTGIPQFNFPRFEHAAKTLRAAGFSIISPHEQDAPEVQKVAWASPDGKLDNAGKVGGLTWGQILAKDVELVADKIDGIIFLPDWTMSRGAKLEAFTGLLTGKKFGVFYQDDVPDASGMGVTIDFAFEVSADFVRDALRSHMP